MIGVPSLPSPRPVQPNNHDGVTYGIPTYPESK